MTKSETTKLMAVFRAAYPNQTITKETVTLYAEMLSEIDAGEANQAARELIRSSRWLPTVAEILAEVRRQFDPFGVRRLGWGEAERLPAVDDGLLRLPARKRVSA